MAMNYTGYGQMGSPIAYSFGGGTIGGPNLWDFSSGRPQLSQTAQLLGVQLLPAGATSRQELRYLKEEAQRSGRPYVEAPTQYVLQRDRRGLPMYINPLTGQTLGTMAADWAGGTGKKSEERKKEPTPKPSTNGRHQKEKQKEPAPEGYVRNKYGYLEPKEWYTEDGRKMTEQEYRESKKTKQTQEAQPRPTDAQFSLFSSYSPLLQNPSLNFPYL